jgi:hypothetical protein
MRAVITIEKQTENGSPTRGAPSKGWVWLGGAIAVLGVAAAVILAVIGVQGYLHRVSGLTRLSVPGQMTLPVAAGGQFVYYEGQGPIPLARLGIRVTDPSGHAVALEPYGQDLRYDAPGNSGRLGHALATFQASGAGPYLVSATGAAPVGSTIAVGESVAKSVVPMVIGIVALVLVTVGGGLALIIVTLGRRSSARPLGPKGTGIDRLGPVRLP